MVTQSMKISHFIQELFMLFKCYLTLLVCDIWKTCARNSGNWNYFKPHQAKNILYVTDSQFDKEGQYGLYILVRNTFMYSNRLKEQLKLNDCCPPAQRTMRHRLKRGYNSSASWKIFFVVQKQCKMPGQHQYESQVRRIVDT